MSFNFQFALDNGRINSGETLIFYTDVMPSETINHKNENVNLALVSAICGNIKLIKDEFNQFKDTRGNHRKVKAARRFRDIVNNGEADIRILSSISSLRELKIMGKGLLNNMIKNVSELKMDGDYYVFGGRRIHSRVALICPWYVFSLVAFAPFVAKMCETKSYSNFAFVLDPMPGDDLVNNQVLGLEFLYFLFAKSALVTQWRKVIEKYSIVNSGFGYIGIPVGSIGRLPPKKEGQSILADWICQSIHAAVNHEWYVSEHENRTEEFRREIAAICFDIKESGGWIDLPVGKRILQNGAKKD